MGDLSSVGPKMGMKSGIHWRVPTAMIVCFVLGLALAISHHFYYNSLNDTTVGSPTQQAWSLRIGTGMAFLTKTFLTTAVGLACVQNLWWILRLKPVRLSTLDSMWDIRGSIFNFFDFHIWLRGPNVAILGLISWTIPLVTVVTPATLSVQSTLVSRVSPQQLLPDFDWSFYKYTTMGDAGPGAPAPIVTRFVSGVIVEGTARKLSAPAPNSTYTHSFIAPYIQCEKGRESINASMMDWHARSDMYRTGYLGFEATSGNISYDLDMAFDYFNLAGPFPDTPLEEDLVEKVILVVAPFLPKTLVECALYNATWTVDFGFHNGEQTQNITDISILNRVPAHPKLQETKDSKLDQEFGYAAIMNVFKEMFVGRCRYNPLVCADTQILKSALSDTKETYGLLWSDDPDPDVGDFPTFVDAANQLGKNITLSLLADPYFHLNSSYAHTINVTIYEPETRYIYAQKNLFIAYGVAVFVTLLCVIAGFLTMWDNGVAFTDSLSTILRTTRSKKFDEIVPDDSTSGADPPPQSLSDTRVMWVSSRGSDDTAAGLKPIPAVAEPEKAENTGSSSPIAFANRIWERKSYHQTSTRADNTSPEGFI